MEKFTIDKIDRNSKEWLYGDAILSWVDRSGITTSVIVDSNSVRHVVRRMQSIGAIFGIVFQHAKRGSGDFGVCRVYP